MSLKGFEEAEITVLYLIEIGKMEGDRPARAANGNLGSTMVKKRKAIGGMESRYPL